MEDVQKLKEELAVKGMHGLALDLDDTLSGTSGHWFDSIYKFHPVEGMDRKKILAEYKYLERVPEWDNPHTHEHISSLIHSNDFHEEMPLIEDADQVVKKINEHLPIVAYITARPFTVREGTVRWLQKHQFPHAELIMRPEMGGPTEDAKVRSMWKASVLVSLYPEINGIVDDNTGLAEELHQLGYEGMLYLYGTDNKEFEKYKNVVVCPTWQSVLEAIERRTS